MTLLTIGLALWIAAHYFQRLFPAARSSLGTKGKPLIALGIVAGLVLMVIGYRGAETVPVYSPMPGMGHLNNLLMLVSVFLFGAGSVKGRVASLIRHPMLWGGVVWGAAHLLVNGDQASLVLFGGIIIWALGQMILINRAVGPWDRPEPGPWAKDAKNLVISVVVFSVIIGIHIWLGYNPFLGTYG